MKSSRQFVFTTISDIYSFTKKTNTMKLLRLANASLNRTIRWDIRLSPHAE